MPLRPAAPPPEPEWLRDVPRGRVLAFAPHPDDEVAGPGGCLALHARAGDPVRVVVALPVSRAYLDAHRRFAPAAREAYRARLAELPSRLSNTAVIDLASKGLE